MSKPGVTNIDGESKSSFMGVLEWIRYKFRDFVGSFSKDVQEYPNDESSMLMERYMARKSWFDGMSSRWVQQPFLMKMAYISGITLLSGLVGLVVGAALITALSALFVSTLVHRQLVSHERNRRDVAQIVAKESMLLNKELAQSRVVLEEIGSKMREVVDGLRTQTKEQGAQATLLCTEGQIIHQQNKTLVTIVDEVRIGKDSLFVNERILQEEACAVAKSLKKYSEVIAHSTEELAAVGETAAQFSRTAQDMQQSTKGLSQATNRFSLFVNTLASVGSSNAADAENDDNDSLDGVVSQKEENVLQRREEIDLLSRQNAAFDAIIEQWGAKGRKLH